MTSTHTPSGPVAATEAMIHDLRGLHAQTTPGVWGKGQTTHHTVAKRDGSAPYRIAEFHHAADAAFCDAAHAFVPALLAQLEAAQRDQARLDWLISQDDCVVNEGTNGFWLCWLDEHDHSKSTYQPGSYPTARAAIDAAMAEKQEGRPA